jgi:uncharacterized OB-fold protein
MRAPTEVPLPQPDAASAPFWAGCAERRLLIPKCTSCGSFQSPPRLYCRNCRGTAFDWHQSRGDGRIHTYTIAHHPASPALREQVPNVVVIVELDECGGARLVSNLVGANAAKVAVGRAVRLLWDDDAGAWLPRFEWTGGETTGGP